MTVTIAKKELTVPKKALCVLLDAADTQSYPGNDFKGTTWYDLSGNGNHFTLNGAAFNSTGVKYMDFNGSYGIAKTASGTDIGIVGKEQGHVTYILWTRIRNSSSGWRTLTRHATSAGDHHVIIENNGWNIGMYDSQNGSGFNSTGYSQQSLPSGWNMLIFRYGSSAPQFRLSINDAPGTILGSISSTNAGYKAGFSSLGGYGNAIATDPWNADQYWGDIAWFGVWNRALSDAECLQVYNATSPRFRSTSKQYQGEITYSDSSTQTKVDGGLAKGEIIQINSYSTSGTFTWTKPEGCTKVIVKVTGGGGGAAGYCESGGAGGYAEKEMDVSNITTVSVTVGAGGASTGYYASATDGGTSSFGSFVTASGGYGANRNAGHTGGVGGVGSGGQINLYGGDGTGHANSHGHYPGGTGGGSFWGGSSTVNRGTINAKLYNGAPGAGGPGSRTDDGGGGGSAYGENGIVVVYSYK